MESKTATEEKIIAALLECRTLAQVADVTGTPPRTLYTLLKKPEFKKQLDEAKAAALGQAVAKLNSYSATAVDVLAEIAMDTEQHGQIRTSACRAILDALARLNEQIDILARLEELEYQQAENSRN